MAYKLFLSILIFTALTAQGQTDVLHLKSHVTDTIFGEVVKDPYRWMEIAESDSLTQWLKEQRKITKAEQSHFNGRLSNAAYNARNNSMYQYTSVEKTGGRFFSLGGSQRVFGHSPVLYSKKNVNEGYRVAYDPNLLDWSHSYSINFWAVSDSSNYLAVVTSQTGSDWQQIRVSDMDSMQYFNDLIDHGRFTGVVWWHDGFFYGKYPDGGRWDTLGTQKLFYHKLGQKQEQDQLITSTLSGAGYRDIGFWVTSNKRYLVIAKNQKIGSVLFTIMAYKDLYDSLGGEWKHVVRTPVEDSCYYSLIDYADSGFLLYSNYKAPHGRILLADMNEANHFYEIVHQTENVILRVTYVDRQLVTLYYTSGQYLVCMYNDTGGLIDGFRFPPGITVQGFRGLPGDTETIFYEQSFYSPTVVYKYNFITRKSAQVDKTIVKFHIEDYVTEIVDYQSADGTDIPMYITYKKGLNLKGNNPVILMGYGNFGRSTTPFYNYSNITFFESGGILAVPMIRGGGEEGAEWHAGGRKLNKQNSFDDFTAAAQYLINKGYTSRDKLAIEGSGNGGLLVAAVMVQHPDLCKVVVARSGVYDMLRYNRFTNGKFWREEYGNPDNPEDFKNLLTYSPLQNLKPHVNYPATLLTANRSDERVVPMHTYKFLARLQECGTQDNPHILYFENDALHNSTVGYGDEDSFVLAFIFTQMHLPIKYLF